jgi:lipoate---protein ligase
MLCILNNNTEPYFNIAAEEYLLKNSAEDIFMLYRNDSSIIVGKHQNTFAEINYWFVKEKNIKVVRRLSGGGTVFHDMGNINFTFIQNGKEGSLVDFIKFTEPIIQTLKNMGVPATRSGRNDIMVDGFKISGNAEHVYKNRTLHHGTLLFSSKLDELRLGLKTNTGNFSDKAVKSVRSPVTNISNYLKDYPIDDFIRNVQTSVLDNFPKTDFHKYTEEETSVIKNLVSEKYSTWDWNFGYSPKFKVTRQGLIKNRTFSLNIEVDKGIITQIEGNHPETVFPESIHSLIGVTYNDDIIKKNLSLILKPDEINNWLQLLF